MTGAEMGFLLLTSHLGDPARKVLTTPQLRNLTKRISGSVFQNPDRELTQQDLQALGYSAVEAERIATLLTHMELLEDYLRRSRREGCQVITRISEGYPQRLSDRLGAERPGCLWYKGDPSLLTKHSIALVGSRELCTENKVFAAEVGKQAALQGYVLISGNARGADQTAQRACLENGGQVISVVADALCSHNGCSDVLYVAEDGFDLGFSPQRALSRNRVVHCLASKVFVAQCRLERGGTWDGTIHNLQHRWSDVFCFSDGSAGIGQLIARGATAVDLQQLQNIPDLLPDAQNLFDATEMEGV